MALGNLVAKERAFAVTCPPERIQETVSCGTLKKVFPYTTIVAESVFPRHGTMMSTLRMSDYPSLDSIRGQEFMGVRPTVCPHNLCFVD